MGQGKEGSYSQEQRFKRYNVNLMSIVSSDSMNYAGFIQNASEEGLAYASHSFTPTINELSPKKIIELLLKMPSGETLKLDCEIKWSAEHSTWSSLRNYTLFKMGMKIIDPPSEYSQYVKTLQQV